MSRRNAAVKRPILPDPQFNSRLASMMVARLMKHGKKSTAQRILSDAFGLIGERTGADPLEVFETDVRNSTPLVEVRARRVGGATYQVPMEVRQERGTAMALRWLVNFSRSRGVHALLPGGWNSARRFQTLPGDQRRCAHQSDRRHQTGSVALWTSCRVASAGPPSLRPDGC